LTIRRDAAITEPSPMARQEQPESTRIRDDESDEAAPAEGEATPDSAEG